MEKVKGNKKVLYYFIIFAIVIELLIIKYCRKSPAYCLMQARDKMRLPNDRGCEGSWLLQAAMTMSDA